MVIYVYMYMYTQDEIGPSAKMLEFQSTLCMFLIEITNSLTNLDHLLIIRNNWGPIKLHYNWDMELKTGKLRLN